MTETTETDNTSGIDGFELSLDMSAIKISEDKERSREDCEVVSFQPAYGWRIVRMNDDNTFRSEPSPGFLLIRERGELRPIAAHISQFGGLSVVHSHVGVFSEEEVREKFEGATWKVNEYDQPQVYLDTSNGQIQCDSYHGFQVEKPGQDSWRLHCPFSALPLDVQEQISIREINAIEDGLTVYVRNYLPSDTPLEKSPYARHFRRMTP